MPVPAPTMSAPLVGCGGKVCRGGQIRMIKTSENPVIVRSRPTQADYDALLLAEMLADTLCGRAHTGGGFNRAKPSWMR
jgi:hypothetical protein